MLLRTFRRWSPFLAHLAFLLVLNLVFDGPALAEQARLRSSLVQLPAELERQGSWPDEATIEEALRVLEGLILPPEEGGQHPETPVEVETLGGGAPLPGEGSAMGEGTGVRAPTPVLLVSAVPPPPSLPDIPAASTAPAAHQPMAAPAAAPSPDAVSLLSGWNLVSLPKQPDNVDPAAVLASISGSYQVAHSYDACSSDPWRTWNPADPAGSSLTAIDHRIGLWVRATAAATLAVSGTEPAETSIQLCQGWNLIGYPLSQPRPVLAALSSIAGRFQRVYGWDPADPADPWEIFDVAVPAWANDLEQMLPGRGYWIYATEDTTLVMSNAGLPPEVAITSPANAAAVTAPTDVVGTAKSDLLERWTLAYRLKGETAFTTFASGDTPVTNGVLGKFDPTLLLNGLYEIELTATDFQGQSVSISIDVAVEGNLKIGHFTLSFVDLEVPLAGLPIQVIRTYDSRDKQLGDFGVGWRLSLTNVRLQEDGPVGENWRGVRSRGFLPTYCIQPIRERVVTVTLPDDQVLRFRPKLSPECQQLVPPQVVTLTYVPLPGTRASLTALDQSGEMLVVGSFPGSVQLWNLESTFIADPDRYRVTMQDGRALEVDQQGGLVSITDLNGNTLKVGRNGITHSSGSEITFERDARGKITRIIDPVGESLTYSYNTSVDLAAVTDRESATTRFTYNNHYLISIQDPNGRQPIRNEYDATGRLIRTTDAFGKTIELTHDLAGNREVITDRLGHSRVLEYDVRGNVIREIDALGKATTRTFDANGLLLSETSPLNDTRSFTYDANRNVTSIIDALGNRTSYTYGDRGQVLTMTDPLGKVTTNTFDGVGNLLSTTDPLGNVTTYTYDSRGNQVTKRDAEGHVTQWSYDSAGNLLRERDALGYERTFTYDRSGNRLSQTTTRSTSQGTETLTWSYLYDREGRLAQTITPDGGKTETTHDASGNVREMVDQLDRRTAYSYDALGLLTRTSYPDGTSETHEYDAERRRIAHTDRAGRRTTFVYDALGRLLTTTFADGAVWTNAYDDAGRRIEKRDARNNATRYEYNAAAQLTKVIDALNNTTTFSYDASGNRIAVTDSRGNTTQYEYDDARRHVRTLYADGTSESVEYDRLGRRTSETDRAGHIMRFGYDQLGRLTTVTDPLNQVTRYAYDELGNRISQTDANGHVTRVEVDELGRRTKLILPDGAAATFAYDPAGNQVRRSDFQGATTAYTYGPNNRLLSRSYPDGSSVSFTYTATGQRETATDGRGTTSYAYDRRDLLTSLTYPDGRQLLFDYDAQGNRTSTTAALGETTLTSKYSYDALNRLQTVEDPTGKVYSYSYDANGNRRSVTYPNGLVTTYGYDTLNRLLTLSTIHTIKGVVQSYGYILGPAGHRIRVDDHDGIVRAYGYDPLHRLVREAVSRAGITSYQDTFTYDPVGNRLRLDRSAPEGTSTFNYTYDHRDRLLTADTMIYGWDANGNLASRSGTDGAVYAWDYENRLIQVQLANRTIVEHAYDADGNRIRTKVTPPTGPPRVTDYMVDPRHSLSSVASAILLPQVVAETQENGSLTNYYVRGDDLLAVLRPDAASQSSFVARFIHADGLGSVRALTDDLANVTDRYDFSAFGTALSHTGPDTNAYLFAGERLDPATGFYDLRARWMDSSVGRFASADPFEGSSGEPATLHRYLYTAADPVNRIDPSGTETLAGLLTGFSITAILVRATVGAIIGAGDAFFRGYSIGSGIVFGAVGGALGPLIPLRIGLAFAIYGVGEALYHGDYDSALYRAATFGFGYILQTRGFGSFKDFKKFWGTAGTGRAWHHIVEQTPANQARFPAEQIHNPSNMVPLSHGKGTIHAKISGFYSSKQPAITGSPNLTIRQWLSTKPYAEQYQFGLEALQRFGGGGSAIDVTGWSTSWFWPAVLAPFSEDESEAGGFGQDGETP